jgi:hypothetical protein
VKTAGGCATVARYVVKDVGIYGHAAPFQLDSRIVVGSPFHRTELEYFTHNSTFTLSHPEIFEIPFGKDTPLDLSIFPNLTTLGLAFSSFVTEITEVAPHLQRLQTLLTSCRNLRRLRLTSWREGGNEEGEMAASIDVVYGYEDSNSSTTSRRRSSRLTFALSPSSTRPSATFSFPAPPLPTFATSAGKDWRDRHKGGSSDCVTSEGSMFFRTGRRFE